MSAPLGAGGGVMPIRVGLLALAAVLAWPQPARSQTVIEREGAYAPGVYRGPCLDLDTHRAAPPKVGDERRVRYLASTIRQAGPSGVELFTSVPPACEGIALERGAYVMQIRGFETRWRYFCRYTGQPPDRCTEITKETVLDTIYESDVAFTISQAGARPNRPPRCRRRSTRAAGRSG
jgi:hypothetical protein